MYYTECERLAERHPDLAGVIERVDSQLQQMRTAEVIRAGDFASFLRVDPNQITSVLGMLAQDGVLRAEEMIECPHCGMVIPRRRYDEILAEEDEVCCTDCERLLHQATFQTITTFRNGVKWKGLSDTKIVVAGVADAGDKVSTKKWPNPAKHTTAKVWTTKNGSLWMSTKTDQKDDGKVEFPLHEDGSPTYQMQFMHLLCFHHPKSVSLREAIEQVYPDDVVMIGKDPEAVKNLLRKVRSIVSDVRTKKFGKAGLNPDILPSLSVESSIHTGISLQLAKLHRLDDKAVQDSKHAPN